MCDAGCILEVLDNYLAEQGYIMPLDLGAKGRYAPRKKHRPRSSAVCAVQHATVTYPVVFFSVLVVTLEAMSPPMQEDCDS